MPEPEAGRTAKTDPKERLRDMAAANEVIEKGDRAAAEARVAAMHVRVVKVDLPFGDMVSLVFKWTMASLVVLVPLGCVAYLLWFMTH